MKVLFLDIGGVIYSDRSHMAYGAHPEPADPSTWTGFDPVAICMLQKVVAATGAHVVLSSSWRDRVSLPTLEYALGVKIMDRTRDTVSETELRGQQIYDWLMQHPEVTRYAILDDDDFMLPSQMDKLCRTSKRNGFLLGHYDELMELLG